MSPRVLRRSFSTAAAALMLTVSAAGCASKDEPPVITPKPEPSAGAPASDAGGDGSVASDGGGGAAAKPTDAAIDKSQLPPENRDLKAPDPKDYPGFYEESQDGQIAALHFYLDAMYYFEATGDDAPVRLVVNDSECSACMSARAKINERIKAGKYASERRVVVLEKDYVRAGDKEGPYLDVETPPGRVVTSDGVMEEIAGKHFAFAALMEWDGKNWKLLSIASEDQS
ncbi:DUF6318 family protein [Helcobacillus sp. ACRRO]|uniref:DUF6318 family protein n=1 Tax=Helcobacillus sp. ACRRO TaxID=2918202 RepID=UPI001EF7492E|nr:DUF6318 family protein [Helcobacillus sp. ACRRO]MCG7426334.1 DUF6318 family protein [Helcobacillus sp. ACRRO]